MVVSSVRVDAWWNSFGYSYDVNGANPQYFNVNERRTPRYGVSGVTLSSRLPGWKQIIRNVGDATTPFRASITTVSQGLTTVELTYRFRLNSSAPWRIGVTQNLTGVLALTNSLTVPTNLPFTGATYQRAYNQAVERLYGKLRDFDSPARVGETVGEFRQTARMLRRPASGLVRLTDYVSRNHLALLKKARWNNVKRISKSLADLTLEWRFGVSPLIKDLESAADVLSTRKLAVDEYHHFSVSGKAEEVVEGTTEKVVQLWINGLDIAARREANYKVRFKGVYRYSAHGDPRSFNASLGLTWRELVPTVYNLIPYSFLLDYFVNLDTFIESVAVPWHGVAWCVNTRRAIASNSYTPTGGGTPRPTNLDVYDVMFRRVGHLRVSGKVVERSSVINLPLPTLEWKVPSDRQLQNIAALLASRLPVINLLSKSVSRLPGMEASYKRSLLARGSMSKVPYPYHAR